jgi:hypothetical protein
MRGFIRALALIGICVGICGGIAGPITSCTPLTPAQTVTLDLIESAVLADLQAGFSLPQIEGDVQAIIKATSPAAAVVIDAIDAALVLLTDLGYIPAGLVPTVSSYRKALAEAKAVLTPPSASAVGAAGAH